MKNGEKKGKDENFGKWEWRKWFDAAQISMLLICTLHTHKRRLFVHSTVNQTVKQYMVGVPLPCVVILSRASCRKFRLFIGISRVYHKVDLTQTCYNSSSILNPNISWNTLYIVKAKTLWIIEAEHNWYANATSKTQIANANTNTHAHSLEMVGGAVAAIAAIFANVWRCIISISCAVCVRINAPKWRVNILFGSIHCIIYFYRRCMQWLCFFECAYLYTLKPSNLIKCHVKVYTLIEIVA